MARLSVRGLTGGAGGRVLFGIDLEVKAGERVVVLGPSGAGKTTLLETVAGLRKPDSGVIEIDGRVVYGPGEDVPPNERGIGIAFQDLGLWPHVNVLDHLSLCMEGTRGTSSRNVDSMMALERLGLRSKMTSYPGELSGGERRRLALARALVVSPKVLLLDEPLTGVDGPLRDQLFDVVSEVHERARSATVLVTHRLDEALALGDTIAILADGRLHQVGPATEVFHAPLTSTAAQLLGFENVIPAEKMGEYVNRIVPLGRQKELGTRENWGVALRANEIVLFEVSGTEQTGVWGGTVREARFAGDGYLTWIDVGQFSVKVKTERPYPAKTEVRLGFTGEAKIVETG